MDNYDAFREICKGDQEAYEFCESFYEYVHVMDDLIDRDNGVPSPGLAVAAFLKLAYVLSFNIFYQRHKDTLMPVIHAGLLEFVDSEIWKLRDTEEEKTIAEVLKSSYQNIFFMVAFCVGGVAHQFEMSNKHRGYTFG
jgi:hypothetical protein